MMKAVLYILLLTGIYISGYSQVPDSVRTRRDSIIYNNIPTDTLPVLADTIQYNDTTVQKTASGKDTVVVKKKVHSPRRATPTAWYGRVAR